MKHENHHQEQTQRSSCLLDRLPSLRSDMCSSVSQHQSESSCRLLQPSTRRCSGYRLDATNYWLNQHYDMKINKMKNDESANRAEAVWRHTDLCPHSQTSLHFVCVCVFIHLHREVINSAGVSETERSTFSLFSTTIRWTVTAKFQFSPLLTAYVWNQTLTSDTLN